MDTIREAPFGQFLRLITGNRVLKYPEELPGFTWDLLVGVELGEVERR